MSVRDGHETCRRTLNIFRGRSQREYRLHLVVCCVSFLQTELAFVPVNICWRAFNIKTLPDIYDQWLLLKCERLSFVAQRRGIDSWNLFKRSAAQFWENPLVFSCDVNLVSGTNTVHDQKKQNKKTTCSSTHLAHDLNVGDALSSRFALLVRLNRQNKISRFGQRLSDQEGPRLVFCAEEFLCVGAWQVTMVPPASENKTLTVYDAASVTHDL